ncbi:MAG TPA: hypothetical protein VLV90_08755 [Burkholderiales bacterium]|nr:hypothetical protein [Burkholderiales bacterium]
MSTVRMLAALLAAVALQCAAEPFSVRIGTEKIVLDTPPGFADTVSLGSPRLQDFAEGFNTASNRLLLFGVTDADMRRFTLGDKLEANRFVMVATPRAQEQQRVTPEQFADFMRDSMNAFGKTIEVKDLVKFLEKQPIGKSNLLAELRREPGVASVMQATRLAPIPGYRFYDSDKPQYLVYTTSLVLVRGKALQLSVYSLTETGTDLGWLRGTTQRWADELRRLNPD